MLLNLHYDLSVLTELESILPYLSDRILRDFEGTFHLFFNAPQYRLFLRHAFALVHYHHPFFSVNELSAQSGGGWESE
jgi:hypothetical protein